MRDEAGRRRRRRILLLREQAAPHLSSISEADALEPAFSGEMYSAVEGDFRVSIRVEDATRRTSREYPFDEPCFQIGRSPNNELSLNHPDIAPQHAGFLWLKGSIYFTALSPAAVIQGPRGPVTAGWWRPGEVLQIGPLRLILQGLRTQPPETDPRAVSAEWETELPRLELRFTGSRRVWPIMRTLTLIGSSSCCKVRLDDERILPVQAALVRTPGRLWLIDFSGDEGSRVNGEPASLAALDLGDRLGIGGFEMEVRSIAEWEPAADPPSAPPASAPAAAEVAGLLSQLQAQQQQFLEAQKRVIESLERLAERPVNAAELTAVLQQFRESCRSADGD